MQMPTHDQLIVPTLQALEKLGGSGSIHEIAQSVIALKGIPDGLASVPHDPRKTSQTELEYRLAWARTYLKKYGLITNSARGVWTFTPAYEPGMTVDPAVVVQSVRLASTGGSGASNCVVAPVENTESALEEETEPGWRQCLHQLLLKMEPAAFERLTMRILREAGFVHVEVTGKTGDGGIDGKGIVKLQSILSYHVVFQCKRYNGAVSSPAIRDFRGAMVGRADKGLFVTTGRFTSDAVKEATRDGAPPIDLIDGDELIDLIKAFELGVHIRMVEEVSIDEAWFASF